MKLPKQHKARQCSPDSPSYATGSTPVCNSPSYFIVFEYQKLYEKSLKEIANNLGSQGILDT